MGSCIGIQDILDSQSNDIGGGKQDFRMRNALQMCFLQIIFCVGLTRVRLLRAVSRITEIPIRVCADG
jgi:hypothetical protein